MAWDFHVGQKVVCVNDSWDDAELGMPPEGFPKRGRVMVIDALKPDRDFAEGYALSFPDADLSWALWKPSHFRPLIERKTDISIFTKILNGIHTPSDLVDA